MATQIFTNAHIITPNQNFIGSVVVENYIELSIQEFVKRKFNGLFALDWKGMS